MGMFWTALLHHPVNSSNGLPVSILPTVGALWKWLTEDVSVLGEFQIPMVTWIGAVGILALFAWHGSRFFYGTRRLHVAMKEIETQLLTLVQTREQESPGWLISLADLKRQGRKIPPSGARRDLDDLAKLDRIMGGKRAYAQDWLAYRRSLTIYQSSWFLEPRVFAEQSAKDYFLFETVCANYVNVRFYQHFPSVLTGTGLLFTFLAILIGLSKLQADGSHIEGLPGFINSLAGKFVTSIIGLASANGFLLLEKSSWHTLACRHRRIIALLDRMFPKRIEERETGRIASMAQTNGRAETEGGNDALLQCLGPLQQKMDETVEALRNISLCLSWQVNEHREQRREPLASVISGEVRIALDQATERLCAAIGDLHRSFDAWERRHQLASDDVDRLIRQLADRAKWRSEPLAPSSKRPSAWRLSRWWS
ncbi:MAG: hypothetical protein NNA23_12110 [Nitrospira sp.]|nr:hypothetical protein [Nitrospira sp.]